MEIIATFNAPKADGKGVRLLTIGRNQNGELNVSWQCYQSEFSLTRSYARTFKLATLAPSHPYRRAAEAKLAELAEERAREENRQP